MKAAFEKLSVPAIKIDNGNAHAFLFGDGELTPGNVHFIAAHNGISPEIEGPDFTDFSPEDQYFAARQLASNVPQPCAVIVLLDEYRASQCPRRTAAELNTRTALPAQGLFQRGITAIRARLG